jgi:hypothetical protein
MDYYDLGAYSRRVTTKSPEAQVWFDRGLNWLFGFNHAEAIKCFAKALEHDPDCAMAHWGIAYAAGPTTTCPGTSTTAGQGERARRRLRRHAGALAVADARRRSSRR